LRVLFDNAARRAWVGFGPAIDAAIVPWCERHPVCFLPCPDQAVDAICKSLCEKLAAGRSKAWGDELAGVIMRGLLHQHGVYLEVIDEMILPDGRVIPMGVEGGGELATSENAPFCQGRGC
jgi:hypothetical protein